MRVRPKEHASMSSSSQVVPSTPDVLVRNEGTVFLVLPSHFPRQTVDRGARPAGRSVVWERLGRRAPFRLGSRPRAEGCRIGAGMITDIGRQERTTKRVALYARVSTVNHGQDPEVQLRELREFCQRRRFEIVVEYVDKGISGSRERRPSLDQLMAICRKRLVDAVVVYRYDRFARSLRQLVLALEEFRALGIDFISLHEGVDTSTPNGRLIFGIFASIAEFERELIRDRVRSGLAAAKAKGKRIGRPTVAVDALRIASLRARWSSESTGGTRL